MKAARIALFACVVALLIVVVVVAFLRSSSWAHRVTTVYQGTRSEGKVARLLFRGGEILPYFREVSMPIGGYEYRFRENPWRPRPVAGGWMETAGKRPQIKRLKERFLREDAERGWYSCAEGYKEPGTPSSWFWVPSLRVWVDASAMPRFVAAYYTIDGWSYRIAVVDETNWELRGDLTYKGLPVPSAVGNIVTPIGSYRWVRSGCERGWLVQDAEGLRQHTSAGAALDEASIARGWHKGARTNPGFAVPEGWAFLPDHEVWTDGAKLEAFLRAAQEDRADPADGNSP